MLKRYFLAHYFKVLTRDIGEIWSDVYGKRQTWICTSWPSFLFSFRSQFVVTSRKSADSSQFYPKNCFELFASAHFEFWEFVNLNLTFAVNVNLFYLLTKSTAWYERYSDSSTCFICAQYKFALVWRKEYRATCINCNKSKVVLQLKVPRGNHCEKMEKEIVIHDRLIAHLDI